MAAEVTATHIRGLSPRVRGSHDLFLILMENGGSIPAGAGEPPDTSKSWPIIKVYPRGCGGAVHALLMFKDIPGLSPRVRGSHRLPSRIQRCGGSIPAGAGEPVRAGVEPWSMKVYPRGCGGAAGGVATISPDEGLSPRVRGSLEDVAGRAANRGSIPAGAGEPLPIHLP